MGGDGERLPWEALVSVLYELKDQKIQRIIDAAGLSVDWSLQPDENYRAAIQRAWLPRIHQAYRALSADQQRRAAYAVAVELVAEGHEDVLRAKLQRIGWDLMNGELVMTGADSVTDRDTVTGLLNRAAFETALPRAVERAKDVDQPLSLVMADIDRFKTVNDTHGHVVGDRVLAAVAARIRVVAAGKGSAYRYGGEELVIVLPNHSTQEAIAVAERARRDLEATAIEGLTVTASFGVSTFPDHAQRGAELFEAADRAMYDAKDRGRNLVRIYGEPEPPQPAREPERRQPVPGTLTDRQRTELRQQHYQGHQVRCPKDDAILHVEESREFTAGPPKLTIRCNLCNLYDEI